MKKFFALILTSLLVLIVGCTAKTTTTKNTTAAPTTVLETTTVEPTEITTTELTEEVTTVMPTTTEEPTTVEPTTIAPTTVEPTTVEPTTVEPTTVEPTTEEVTTTTVKHDGLTPETAFTVEEALANNSFGLTESGTFTATQYYIRGYIMSGSLKSYNVTTDGFPADYNGKDYNFKLVNAKDDTTNYISVSYGISTADLAAGDEVIVYGYVELYNSYISIYPLSKTYGDGCGWAVVTKNL